MNMFARFDENPFMTLQDIKETKRYGRTDGRSAGVVMKPETARVLTTLRVSQKIMFDHYYSIYCITLEKHFEK